MRQSLSFVLVASTCLVSACSTLFPGGGGGNPAGDTPPPVWITHNVRVNTVGYTTGHAKVATVVLPDGMTTVSDDTAEVFDQNGNLQWACELTGPFTDMDLNATYYFADFTAFDDPGTFYLQVPGLGSDETAQSAPFQIGPDVLAGALTTRDDRALRPALRYGGEDHDGERHLAARRLPPARRRFAQVPDRRRHTVSQRRRLARRRRLRQVRQQRRLQRGDAARGLGALSADARGAGAARSPSTARRPTAGQGRCPTFSGRRSGSSTGCSPPRTPAAAAAACRTS